MYRQFCDKCEQEIPHGDAYYDVMMHGLDAGPLLTGAQHRDCFDMAYYVETFRRAKGSMDLRIRFVPR